MSDSKQRPIAVRFEDVGFSYGEIKVLEGASFHIHEGEFAALLGPNGSGKTTILRLILGLARPGSGRVQVFGEAAEGARRLVGYVPQAAAFDPAFPATVEAVVRMGRLRGSLGRYSRTDRGAVSQAMERMGIGELARRRYAELSGGQRRRVLVARALAAESRLLLLDEPTTNMDARSEELLYRGLGALKGSTTVLIVTHDTGFVSALTDSVYCLGEGGRGVVHRHPAAPAERGLPEARFGGAALRVLHHADLPADGCFEEEEK